MNILLINDYINAFGGAETAVMNTKRILEKNGHKVVLLGEKTNKDSIRTFFERWFNLKYYFKTKKIIREKKIDVIHINSCTFISPSPILASKKMNKKTVMTFHSLNYYCPRTWGIDKSGKTCLKDYDFCCLFRGCPTFKSMKMFPLFLTIKWLKIGFHRHLIRKYTDYFICPSKKLKEFMQKTFKLPEEKIFYVPNFIEIPNSYNVDFSKIKNNQFLFVGRISEEKGIDIAIKAINILIKKEELKDLCLKIIGSGNEADNLKKLVKKLNIENNIQFLGKVDNDKLDKYYQESLAVLIPSVWFEAFGLVNIEAMKNKTPIIASKVGGIMDIVEHGKNGYLFKLGDYKDMSRYIKKLYKNTELSKKLGENGFKKVKEEFNEKKHYNELMKIYSNQK